MILKVNDLAVQAELGVVGSDPRWAVAWKVISFICWSLSPKDQLKIIL